MFEYGRKTSIQIFLGSNSDAIPRSKFLVLGICKVKECLYERVGRIHVGENSLVGPFYFIFIYLLGH
jgi:hypothetical protein